MMISDIIHREVKERYDVELDPRALKLGSVLPDFWPKYSKADHTKEAAIDWVKEMINELRRDKVPGNRGRLFRYSMRLGIIMHYLTDFFCYAHNHPMFHKSIRHLKYEVAMLKKFKLADIKDILGGAFKRVKKHGNRKNIGGYIEEKHTEYIFGCPGMEKDINYSLTMCASVVFSILEGS
jgi:hypothetical protein